jgi:hypothetical protein
MLPKSAISKLQAILIIDIIIVASAAAGFFYINSLPGPVLSDSQIQVVGLLVTPPTGIVGQAVTVLVNATNVGGEAGTYTVNLILDGIQNQAQKIKLADGETKTVEFTISGATEGTHVIGVGNLEGTFTLTSTFELSDLAVNRTEAKIGEPIGITVNVVNKAQESGSYSVALSINDSVVQTKTGQLDGGASTSLLFEVVEQNLGTYQFKIGALNGTFIISPSAPPPKPAEFQVGNLTIDPEVAQPGLAVNVTAKITNVGEASGSYSVDFKVNNAVKDSKTVQLSGGETATVAFTVTETAKGTYTVAIGNATGTFSVQEPSKITLTGMIVKPYEVWAGQTVTVTAKGNNQGTSASSLSLKLKVGTTTDNLQTLQTKTLTLEAGATGTVDFTITADPLPGGDSLTYLIDVNGMQGGYMVVKTGFHTLNVNISPRGDADFNITYPDGHQEKHTTFWTALLPEGSYKVTMPLTDPTGRITFLQWDDGSTGLSIAVSLTTRISLTATYTGGSSCPSLYMWNGTGYVYVAEVSNHGWLGYTRYMNSDGSMEYWRNNPEDYLLLNSSQLHPVGGNYNLTLVQRWDEVFFLDSAYMMVVDHPANQSVYSTMVEQYIDPNYMGQIYTVSKNPLTPVSATNELVDIVNGTVVSSYNKVDALSQISKLDGVFTTGYNGKYSQDWNNQTWNRLTLNLGNLTNSKQIKLVLNDLVDFGPDDSYNLWMNKFYGKQLPDHTEPTPVPYMEVKDANGNWIRVPDNRQIPLAPDGVARTYVVDLTGLFPTNNYELRITNFWNVTYDYIGVDTTPQQNSTTYRINPQAYLSQLASSPSTSTGNFTKYGNVTQLLQNEDDEFVIGRQGDVVSLQFPTANLPALAPGIERSYFFFVATWFKTQYANYGFGPGNDGFTVNPLPFQNMSGFPYPLNKESYPNDTEHQNYLQQWNTRTINPPSTQPAASVQSIFPVIALSTLFLLATANYITLKLHRTHFLGYPKKQTRK